MAPTLFLMCGLPCSGKTTLARCLERERRALRLTPDEWIAKLLSEDWDQAELDRLRSPVEAVQWDVAARVLALGVDVILDWGLWGRGEADGRPPVTTSVREARPGVDRSTSALV